MVNISRLIMEQKNKFYKAKKQKLTQQNVKISAEEKQLKEIAKLKEDQIRLKESIESSKQTIKKDNKFRKFSKGLLKVMKEKKKSGNAFGSGRGLDVGGRGLDTRGRGLDLGGSGFNAFGSKKKEEKPKRPKITITL